MLGTCLQAGEASAHSAEMSLVQERLEEVRGQLEDAQSTVQVNMINQLWAL